MNLNVDDCRSFFDLTGQEHSDPSQALAWRHHASWCQTQIHYQNLFIVVIVDIAINNASRGQLVAELRPPIDEKMCGFGIPVMSTENPPD